MVGPIEAGVAAWLKSQLFAASGNAVKSTIRQVVRGDPVDAALDAALEAAIELAVDWSAGDAVSGERLEHARAVVREVWDRPNIVTPQPATSWLDRVHQASEMVVGELTTPHGVEGSSGEESSWDLLATETSFERSPAAFAETLTAMLVEAVITAGAQPGSPLSGIGDQLGRAIDNRQADRRTLAAIEEGRRLTRVLPAMLDQAFTRHSTALAAAVIEAQKQQAVSSEPRAAGRFENETALDLGPVVDPTASSLRPAGLLERQDVLDHLSGKIAAGIGRHGRYEVLTAPPWHGKTAVMAELAVTPPREAWTVAFFIQETRRRNRSTDFLLSVNRQLASLLDEPTDTSTDFRLLRSRFEALLVAGAARAATENRVLCVLLDALDEQDAREDVPISTVLPPRVPDNVVILLSTRPNPSDFPGCGVDHQLSEALRNAYPLEESPYAHDVRERAAEAVMRLRSDSRSLASRCYGHLALTGVPLTDEELADLLGEHSDDVRGAVQKFVSLTFGGGTDTAPWTLAHKELLGAVGEFRKSWRLERLAELQAWFAKWDARRWPPDSPRALLESYWRSAHHGGDASVLTVLARNHFFIRAGNRDPVTRAQMLQLSSAVLSAAAATTDSATVVGAGLLRCELLTSATALPTGACGVLAKLGRWDLVDAHLSTPWREQLESRILEVVPHASRSGLRALTSRVERDLDEASQERVLSRIAAAIVHLDAGSPDHLAEALKLCGRYPDGWNAGEALAAIALAIVETDPADQTLFDDALAVLSGALAGPREEGLGELLKAVASSSLSGAEANLDRGLPLLDEFPAKSRFRRDRALRAVAITIAERNAAVNRHVDRAVAIARAIESDRQLSSTLAGIAIAVVRCDPPTANELLNESIAISQPHDQSGSRSWPRWLIPAAMVACNPESDEALEEAITLIRGLDKYERGEVVEATALALLRHDPGDRDRQASAIALIEESSILRRAGQSTGAVIATIHRCDPGRALSLLKKAIAEFQESSDEWVRDNFRLWLVEGLQSTADPKDGQQVALILEAAQGATPQGLVRAAETLADASKRDAAGLLDRAIAASQEAAAPSRRGLVLAQLLAVAAASSDNPPWNWSHTKNFVAGLEDERDSLRARLMVAAAVAERDASEADVLLGDILSQRETLAHDPWTPSLDHARTLAAALVRQCEHDELLMLRIVSLAQVFTDEIASDEVLLTSVSTIAEMPGSPGAVRFAQLLASRIRSESDRDRASILIAAANAESDLGAALSIARRTVDPATRYFDPLTGTNFGAVTERVALGAALLEVDLSLAIQVAVTGINPGVLAEERSSALDLIARWVVIRDQAACCGLMIEVAGMAQAVSIDQSDALLTAIVRTAILTHPPSNAIVHTTATLAHSLHGSHAKAELLGWLASKLVKHRYETSLELLAAARSAAGTDVDALVAVAIAAAEIDPVAAQEILHLLHDSVPTHTIGRPDFHLAAAKVAGTCHEDDQEVALGLFTQALSETSETDALWEPNFSSVVAAFVAEMGVVPELVDAAVSAAQDLRTGDERGLALVRIAALTRPQSPDIANRLVAEVFLNVGPGHGWQIVTEVWKSVGADAVVANLEWLATLLGDSC